MIYKTKSVILGRRKAQLKDKHDDLKKPCFIDLFDINNPHKQAEPAKKIIEFEKIHKIMIRGLKIDYLLPGNDLVINNLDYIDIKKDGDHIHLSGKHSNGGFIKKIKIWKRE